MLTCQQHHYRTGWKKAQQKGPSLAVAGIQSVENNHFACFLLIWLCRFGLSLLCDKVRRAAATELALFEGEGLKA